jgi:hypothetical protein
MEPSVKVAQAISLTHRFSSMAEGCKKVINCFNGFYGDLLLIAFIPFLFGCAGYHLGPTNGYAAGDKSIQIMPFVNQTLEPRLTDAVTAQIRKQVQHDGTFRLATHDDGDIIVTGTITKYTRHELSFQPADTLTARDYRISLTAQVTARERISGKVVLDQEITGFTLLRVGSDLVSSERQSLPLLANDLAKIVTARLADGSW